ncbi:PNPLA2 (predicted) [Pycnogonum litorale]
MSMNLSFAGCGFLGIYHVGVASCIKEYAPSLYQTKISGASAGAICACALICDCSLGDGTTQVLKVAVKARSRALGPFHPSFNIVEILRKGLEDILPEDAHIRCSGRLFISLTRVSDGKNELVSEYHSKEDLIQAVICSSFIPVYSGIIPPKFHGERYIDGSLSDNLPVLDENTITVSPFCGECDICPQDESDDIFQVFLANTSINISPANAYRFTKILFPAHPDSLNNLCKQGFDDALRFLQRNNLISCTRCLALTSSIAVDSESDESNCVQRRHLALLDSLPDNVVNAIQAAADSLDKGMINWIFNRRPMKLLSLLTAPYVLPLDVMYLCFLKVWKNMPDLKKDIYSSVKNVSTLVRNIMKYFNKERHRYSAKFTYELAITEIDHAQLEELINCDFESAYQKFSYDPSDTESISNQLVDVMVDVGDHQVFVSEKVLDSVSMNFDLEIPADTVDAASQHHKRLDIVDAIKATAPGKVPNSQAAINISNKALAWERKRLAESDDMIPSNVLDQAVAAPKQSEAIMSFCYLDNDRKTVKITQLYNMAGCNDTEINNSNLQWDDSWSSMDVGYDEVDGGGGGEPTKSSTDIILDMSNDYTKTDSYSDFLSSCDHSETKRYSDSVVHKAY